MHITRRPDRLLRVREVADRLGISLRSTWALVSAGKLRTTKPTPGTTRVRETELESYIERCSQGA